LSGKYHKNPELVEKMSGFRKGRIKRNIERTRQLITVMEEIANNHQATVAQVALNWLIHFSGDIVVTIPGATKSYQAKDSAGAMKFVLNEDELDRLDRASRDLQKR